MGKDLLEDPKQDVFEVVEKDVESLGRGTNCRENKVDWEEWRSGFKMERSPKAFSTIHSSIAKEEDI